MLSSGVRPALEADDVAALRLWMLRPDTGLEDAEPEKGQTALLLCARGGRTACLRELLRAGADHGSRMSSGGTAMYMSAQQGHVDCLDTLLVAGADANALPWRLALLGTFTFGKQSKAP